MTAKVVRLDDRRLDGQRRDNQTIAVYEQPLTDWSEPADSGGADKQRNSR